MLIRDLLASFMTPSTRITTVEWWGCCAVIQGCENFVGINALLVRMEAGKVRSYIIFIGWPKTQLSDPYPRYR